MKPQSITLCAIVQDDEDKLERCLQSVQGVVDEIIIIDLGVRNDTVAIAKQYAAKLLNVSDHNDLLGAKNYAGQMATCDYILCLDANEYLDPRCKATLSQPLTADYYFFKIRTMYRYGLVDTHSSIRLYSRDKGFVYKGTSIEWVDTEESSRVTGDLMQVIINHDSLMLRNIREDDKNYLRLKLLEEELEKKPTLSGYFSYINEVRALGDKGIFSIDLSQSRGLYPNSLQASKVIVYQAQNLIRQKLYQEALAILKDGLVLFPTFTDLHYLMGILYLEINYLKDAERAFLKCLELGEIDSPFYYSVEGAGTCFANAFLAEIYLKLNQYELAGQYIVQSISQNKSDISSFALFMKIFKNAAPEDLLIQIKRIYGTEYSTYTELISKTLYSMRHPLALLILEEKNVAIDSKSNAWRLQVHGKYEEAKEILLQSLDDFEHREVIFLSILTKDTHFFEKFKSSFSQQEWEFLNKMVSRLHIIPYEVNDQLNNNLKNLFYDILMLREYEVVEYVINQVNEPMIRFELSEILYEYQFSELALQAIMEPQKPNEKSKVFLLTGDILKKLNMHGDAYHYYLRTLEDEPPTFEKLYNIFELATIVGDESTQIDYLDRMSKIIPESEWVKVQRRVTGNSKEYLFEYFSNILIKPLISLIIRTKNRPDLLQRCLHSVDSQIYPSIEVVVVNDGGADVSRLLEEVRFPVRYVVHEESKGRAAALNAGLLSATGEYINFLDDDDLLYPTHVAMLVKTILNEQVPVVYSDSMLRLETKSEHDWVVIHKKKEYSQEFDPTLLRRMNFLPILTVMFKRELIACTGLVNEGYNVLEDWDLWIRLSNFADFIHVAEVSCEYSQRVNGDNATQNEGESFQIIRSQIYESTQSLG
ncbi:glycosyltransferase [Paenibacillus sp. ISL-20]|uniref:glycosyltransferase n=1 Tax=Paenibacillus sp. ISL-20 TaxID=2819163 RepID=UPI001BE99378|nr:glycosyltransferase [Paenibacillus sp. ISL-20]MBT2764783.1 glycosyltransferase [Paenibacillus sp. ISL-20]